MSDPSLLRMLARGLGDIEEWRLGDAERAAELGFPREFAAPVLDDWGIVFVDVTLDAATGDPVCHEVNGPNAVGSDALTGDSKRRATFEVRQALRRAREQGHVAPDGRVVRPIVTVHAHQHWSAFRTAGEFYPRVGLFAEFMARGVPGSRLALRGAGDDLGEEDVSVVLGDVPGVAEHLAIDPDTGRFRYQGRPVVFIGNPNLLSELVRIGRLAPDRGRSGGVDLRVFHAWRLVHVVHDKAQQQELLDGTGLRPLRTFEAGSRDAAVRATRAALAGGPIVLKPNGTSGGAGVHVVTPTMTDAEIRARVDAVVDDCVQKYGTNTELAVMPIRGFEFVRSTPYPMADGGHLWDLRIAVEFEPGTAYAYPVSIRLTPEAFDPEEFAHDRDQWISNVSGREVTLLRWGLDLETLEAVGLTAELLDSVVDACVTWTQKAWDLAARGADRGAIYEDAAEQLDHDFYPREKFAFAVTNQGDGKQVPTRYEVLPVIVDRWSPRSFSEREPEDEKLRSVFEAARLAPSAHNTQPPRFILTRRGHGDAHERLARCLSEANQQWAPKAPVLVLANAIRERFSQVELAMVAYPHAMHDLGLAVMSLILQAQSLGLGTHPMAGFDPELASEALSVPTDYEPGIVIALGYRGSPDALPDDLRRREVGPRSRRDLEDVVFEEEWGRPCTLFADEVSG